MENRNLTMEFGESQFDVATNSSITVLYQILLAIFAGQSSKNLARHIQGGGRMSLQRIVYSNS
jgi:hypothetical protein